ncbi:unnamed protein product, partial [Prorocentrum cordatum]
EVEEEEEREEEEAAGQMEEEEEEGEQQEEEKEVRRGHPRGRALFLPAVSCLGRAGGRRPGVPQGPRPAAEPPGAGCPRPPNWEAWRGPGRTRAGPAASRREKKKTHGGRSAAMCLRRAGPERGGRARPRGRAAVPRLAFAARWADAQELGVIPAEEKCTRPSDTKEGHASAQADRTAGRQGQGWGGSRADGASGTRALPGRAGRPSKAKAGLPGRVKTRKPARWQGLWAELVWRQAGKPLWAPALTQLH